MPNHPVVVAYGMGVDSTAILVGLHQRGIRPDQILFADTGGEKPDTYLYAPIIRQWLRDVDFPQFEVVRYRPPIAPYDSLYGECHQNHTLPSLAFRMKSCSIKWKRVPQDRRVQTWEPALECWDAGDRVQKLIGFDATETRRRYGDRGTDPLYQHWIATPANDCLSLVGRDMIAEVLCSELGNQERFEAAVFVGCDGSSQFAKLILHGENYIGMLLAEAAHECFAANAASHRVHPLQRTGRTQVQ